jgi:DNA polymerase-3 subunit gamma/tau
MPYQVIARKWRPQRFADLVGQEHIAQTLKNAITSGRIAHAYLFVGPRGIGKTTSARIFAKALNCLRPVDGEPCCECSSCTAIASESSVDVIEIDAATHTQVEKAREICEEALHMPISSKFKIFIIDEVHMLSKQAWNALLKTIEEPPSHAKFIFATTEVNKVLPTVISRCQRFDLRRIPAKLIAERLAVIANAEGVKISPSALDVIARAADGGMRDAQSLLDQIISFFASDKTGEISEEQALSLFGLTAPAEMEKLVSAILRGDRASVVMALYAFAEKGKNLEVLFEEILTWLRGVMLCQMLQHPETVMDEGADKIILFRKLAGTVDQNALQRLLEQLSSTGYLLREAINKQVFIETILMKAMRVAHAVQIEDLIARLNVIRRGGELAVLDKVPALAEIPPQPKLVASQPPIVEAAPLVQAAPPAQTPASAPSAAPAPIPAPASTIPAAEIPPSQEPVKKNDLAEAVPAKVSAPPGETTRVQEPPPAPEAQVQATPAVVVEEAPKAIPTEAQAVAPSQEAPIEDIYPMTAPVPEDVQPPV